MTPNPLGDYSLIKELEAGSLGTLYLAEHRFLKRPFAVKVLPESIVSDSEFIERFESEVTALYQLDHPNLVKVHNVSCVEGRYFLATDCIQQDDKLADNLEEFLDKHPGRLKEDTIFHIVLQIADALDYIHRQKKSGEPLAHRALKLSNILVDERPSGYHVFLADFGLSRLVGPAWMFKNTCHTLSEVMKTGVSKEDLTPLQKSFVESLYFLAPEQKAWTQSDINADARSDIYSFGLIVYYLFMRELPSGFFEMPSQRFSDLQGDWDRLISLCLQSNPTKRPTQLSNLVKEVRTGVSPKEEKFTPASEEIFSNAKKEPIYTLKLNLKPQEIARPQFEPDPGAIFQTESVVMKYQPATQEMKNLDPIMSEMVIIPGGSFYRGSNHGVRDESPRHQIHLDPFAMDVHPVTNEQFVRFLEVMGGEKDANNSDMIRLRESRIKRSGGKLNIESGYSRHPVVGVTWYGAIAYARWIGKRLPSEAEWEVAACGGMEDVIYPTGKNIERPQANFFSSDTTSVMSYPPNNYGIFDMAGNVYEWCNDWYDYHYYNASVQEPDNPKGPLQGVYRVLRGGCWKSLKEDLRCAHRHRNNPGVMNGTYGFRCVADVAISE
ncbi:MAG: serine/threonine protein kinase [Chlamydiae bacterium]|nr:serine/threonine protein kinase [Chlamydiota bacterium]